MPFVHNLEDEDRQVIFKNEQTHMSKLSYDVEDSNYTYDFTNINGQKTKEYIKFQFIYSLTDELTFINRYKQCLIDYKYITESYIKILNILKSLIQHHNLDNILMTYINNNGNTKKDALFDIIDLMIYLVEHGRYTNKLTKKMNKNKFEYEVSPIFGSKLKHVVELDDDDGMSDIINHMLSYILHHHQVIISQEDLDDTPLIKSASKLT
jgi:hypothetical protein